MKGKLAIIAAAVLIGTAGTYILNENTVERDTVEIQQETLHHLQCILYNKMLGTIC